MLTVATFNSHCGVDRRNRRYDVVGAVERLDADVIALQEVWHPHDAPSFAAEAAQRLGYELHAHRLAPGVRPCRPAFAPELGPAEGWFDLALLSRFPSRALDAIVLGRAPLDRARRVALPVEVDVPGGGTVLVAVTHISHHLFGSPGQIRHLARALPRSGRPAIALGDFNLWGPVVQLLCPGWRRAVRGRTWPAWRPHSQIDHILVNADVEVVRGEVLAATESDHRPIRAVCLLRAAAGGGR